MGYGILQAGTRQNGGDAIVFHGESESVIHSAFWYSPRVKSHATVLYVYPRNQ